MHGKRLGCRYAMLHLSHEQSITRHRSVSCCRPAICRTAIGQRFYGPAAGGPGSHSQRKVTARRPPPRPGASLRTDNAKGSKAAHRTDCGGSEPWGIHARRWSCRTRVHRPTRAPAFYARVLQENPFGRRDRR
jgi:hypothetical protein